MAVGDWIANLFQSEQTRGLSGGAAGGVALDDANPYYNYRLRRHEADGEIATEPKLLWYTSSHVKRRTGLGMHIASEKGDGVAGFTDVLLILSQEDYAEAVEHDTEGQWLQRATLILLQEFEDFCKREGFSRRHDHRQLGFKFVCDGSDEMHGQSLGLAKGEFVSGLLPNLYTGPVRGSRPVIGVHVNLPGVWEGYREIGRLYNDQILFTIGNHWLDNFQHDSLREAAIYRLQQHPDGSFVHIVNPDLQDRYQVTSTNQGGASVLTLATREGDPLAYMVLAVIDEEEEQEAPAAEAKRPGIDMPAAPKPTPRPGGYTIPPPMLAEDKDAISIGPKTQPPDRQSTGRVGSQKTIIPDAFEERIFTLQERGALLQKVHFGAFMEGYDVYVGQRGEMGTAVDDPAAIFQVRRRYVSFISNVVDAKVGGRAVEPGEETPINGDVVIEVAGQKLEYRDLRGEQAEGWPYVGEIRRPTSSTYMMWGDGYQIGRSRECRVVLPDEPRNDNIHWKAKVGDGATIRARTGEIPKSRFYTDSIMVASEHGEIDLNADDPKVRCTARHCYVYVRRGDEVFPLFPTTSGRQPLEMPVEPGDEILIGNCLFKIGYTPVEDAVAPAPAPDVQLTADKLVDSVGPPVLGDLEAPTTPADDEIPAAAGLGERGAPPEPPPLSAAGPDSILGEPQRDEELSLKERLSRSLKEKIAASQEPAPAREAQPRKKERTLDLYDDDDEDEVAAADDEATELGAPGRFEDGDFDLPDFGGGDEEEVEEERWDAVSEAADEVETEVNEPLTEEVPAEEVEEAPAEEPAEEVPEEVAEEAPAEEVAEEEPAEEEPAEEEPEEVAEEAPAEEPPAEVAEEAPAQEAAPAAAGPPQVVFVDDGDAQFELSRRVQVLQIGWMVSRGEMVCGNHSGADLVVPENRLVDGQKFKVTDYFKIVVRGRRASLELLAPSEILVDGDDPAEAVYEKAEAVVLDLIRRDDMGEEDFGVRMALVDDPTLPDPRARFLEMDVDDPLAAALFTKGLPTGQPRVVELQGLTLTFFEDEGEVQVTDYLASYKRPDGYAPFFVQHGEERYQTAPEDGSEIRLAPGDRFLIENAIYEIVEQ